MVTITCVYNNVSHAFITISDYTGTVLIEHPLIMSPQSINFNLPATIYTPGTYIVTLFCDGVVVDSKTFVKQ
jgi:hypothetical protein